MQDLVGTGNLPSTNTVTDAQMVQFIVHADARVDALTKTALGGHGTVTYSTTVDDTGVSRDIRAASTFLAGSILLRRLASEELEGVKTVQGSLQDDSSTRSMNLLKMAAGFESDAMSILKVNRSGLYSLKRTL